MEVGGGSGKGSQVPRHLSVPRERDGRLKEEGPSGFLFTYIIMTECERQGGGILFPFTPPRDVDHLIRSPGARQNAAYPWSPAPSTLH